MSAGDLGPGEHTRALHGPAFPALAERPLALPVWRATTYAFDTAQEYANVLGGEATGYSYARIDSPTAQAFADALAALEGVGVDDDAFGPVLGQPFASGMAAISSTLVALTRAGSHVVAPAAIYGGTYSILENVLSRFGVRTSYVDVRDHAAIAAAIEPDTSVLFAETIANPTLAVADLPALAVIAHDAGIPLIVDSTFASPAVCRPLALGADVVLHSATKYIGGHSDVTGGVAAGRAHLLARIRATRVDLGGSLAPDDAWLLHRGLQTLPLRMSRHCAVAGAVAAALKGHPKLAAVDYPGLASHPDRDVAARDFTPGRFGGVVTLTPRGGHEAGLVLCDGLRVAAVATSLGGTHTLVSHVASTTHRQLSPDALAAAGIDPGAVRMSCGLEDPADLVADITRALDAL